MSYFTKQNLLFLLDQYSSLNFLNESTRMKKYASEPANKFDIFLSHSYSDRKYIKGLYALLTRKMHLDVYVDCIVDPELNRNDISAKTAKKIQHRLKQSELLIFAISYNALLSWWAQWEIGFFDGYKGKVCILPIQDYEDEEFIHQEYLMLYPKIQYSEIFPNISIHDNNNFYKFANKPKNITEWIAE